MEVEPGHSIPRSKRLPRGNLPRRNGGRVTRLNVAFLGTRRRERREGRSLSPGDVDGSRR